VSLHMMWLKDLTLLFYSENVYCMCSEMYIVIKWHGNTCAGGYTHKSYQPLQPSGYLCTARFNMHKFYILPTQCIYGFCVDLRTNSDYFPMQH